MSGAGKLLKKLVPVGQHGDKDTREAGVYSGPSGSNEECTGKK